MQVLITGGAGFIGSALVRLLLQTRPDWQLTVFDVLGYAGHRCNLEEVLGPRLRLVVGDVAEPAQVDAVVRETRPRLVFHLAAESHVDRSLYSAAAFVRSNVLGTQVLLDAVRRHGVDRMLVVSTDEVYGELGPAAAPWREEAPLAPRNPYAASKASADLLALAAARSHGLPVVLTRGCNTLGPRQQPEKFVPLFIGRALAGETLPLYGDGLQRRQWFSVEDHARGLLAAAERGRPGEVYHLAGIEEQSNRSLAGDICRLCGAPESTIRSVSDRPGHDRRYALNGEKAARELGFRAQEGVAAVLARTVAWYRSAGRWLEQVSSPEHRAHLERWYRGRGEA